jgi:phosphoribosylamine--glycine ligase
MNILLLGSGGREHALAWKLSRSPLLNNLYIAPGNAGTATLGTNLPLHVNNFQAIAEACRSYQIGMLIVGPEEPLVKGIHDYFLSEPSLRGIPVIGPVMNAARLEGSKDFAKAFMKKYGIPTASYETFSKETLPQGLEYLNRSEPPYVLKADGLAAGKGVVICHDRKDASGHLTEMLAGERFGEASQKVVIEQFLTGIELSVFILTDGITYRILPSAKDYKKIGEGDTGPNTGGMGSVSPVPFAGKAFMKKVEQRIIGPTMEGLLAEGIRYQGFLFFGLMNAGGDPMVIEYNCRLGDPETEAILPRLRNDLLGMLISLTQGNLDRVTIETDTRFAASVMIVSKGYPGSYEKGKRITGIERVEKSILFHAGTRTGDTPYETLTDGGRIIAVTAYGNTLKKAVSCALNDADKISFEGKYLRKDIGFDL